LCQCTSFDVEAFDLFFFPKFFLSILSTSLQIFPQSLHHNLNWKHYKLSTNGCLGVAMVAQALRWHFKTLNSHILSFDSIMLCIKIFILFSCSL
jgi:hypothetical protein